MTNYQIAKKALKGAAKYAKEKHPTDKPAVRMCINDTADFLQRDYDLSEYKTNLLHNYACTLHP